MAWYHRHNCNSWGKTYRNYCTLTWFSTSADQSVIASSASYLTQQGEWLELVSKASKHIFKWTCYPRNLTVTILLVLQCLMAEIYFIFKKRVIIPITLQVSYLFSRQFLDNPIQIKDSAFSSSKVHMVTLHEFITWK